MKQIIGLCGDKYHGKDTCADALVANEGFVRFAFADALKETAAAAFGRPVAEFHTVALKEAPLPGWPGWTYRKVLEWLGTEVFRTNFPGIWMKTVLSKIEQSSHDKFVITDVRFVDEAACIRALGGKIVRVVNPNVPSTPADPQECETLGLHPSMWNHRLITEDATIHNIADIKAAQTWMLLVYQSMFGGK